MTVKVHIALDVEPLDKRPTALVLSSGMVVFTLVGGEVASFYVEPSKEEQKTIGRTVDEGTVHWWSLQNEAAQFVLQTPGIPVLQALNGMGSFLSRFQGGGYEIGGVWGYGSDFDNAMVQDLSRAAGFGDPWPYGKNRCGRTVVELAALAKPQNVGTHHNALDDARFQANRIRQSLIALGVK